MVKIEDKDIIRICPECGESIQEKDKRELCKACRKKQRKIKRKEWWDKHGPLVLFLGVSAGIAAAGAVLSKAGISLDDGADEEKEVSYMPKYKVILYYPDGSEQECDEIFDTEEEAEEYGNNACGEYSTGAEILNLSNPGDYPLEDGDELDYEVIEIDD